jgi:hypothetical protein
LWERVDKYCQKNDLGASVWVDDIAISGENAEKHLNSIKQMIHGYGYKVSWEKVEIVRNHKKPQEVTGGIVNSSRVSLPKKKRRDFAKEIKSDPLSTQNQGRLAYTRFLSPTQGKQLNKLKEKLIDFAKSKRAE